MWWLRTPGEALSKAAYVDENGAIQYAGKSVTDYLSVGIRPAMWISTE